MPITVDGVASATGKAVNTLTFALTVTNHFDRVLIVRTANRASLGENVTGITFNGVAMFRQAFITLAPPRSELWYLVAPSVGTFNVVVTWSANDNVAADARSYYGVDQSTPIGNAFTASANSAAPAVNVTSADTPFAVGLVIDALAAMEILAGTLTAAVLAGQTQEVNQKTVGAPNVQNILQGTSRRFFGANPQAMGWTLSAATPWAFIGSYLRPARARMVFNAKGSASASFNPRTFDFALEARLRNLESRVGRHDYRLRD